jgi:hypothetical protein
MKNNITIMYNTMNISSLCTPALIYLILSAITILVIFIQQFSVLTIFLKVSFVVVWTWVLNYLCAKGYSGISWIMVLLPYIVMFGVLALVLEFTNKINGYLSNSIISTQPKYVQPVATMKP